ncbi:exopolysaccharide production protein [Naasia sp. SYSU D00948]|uniref:exopolysaccharide production protein n=1 Tax=Naasia sp. SYSU D00948 TaxID=2817379 RepID=UPI001B3182D6|nr:exopolysaccharide production protein [Naasia sp. SYSU D00948]
MASAPGRRTLPAHVRDLIGSAPFGAALATATVAAVLLPHLTRTLIGWPGYIAVLWALAVLSVGALLTRHRVLDWHGILPVSILLFVGWCSLSVFWSEYQWATVSGVVYQLGIAFLAVFVAITRDLIQVVRAFGDVLRVLLILSIGLEILSGLLLDVPFRFLGIEGNLALGGPIQGVAGSRNQLGLIALLAILTFAVEWATRSVPRPVAVGSLVLAALTLLLTRSPVSLGIAVAAGLIALALLGIRRAPADRRPALQALTLSLAAGAIVLGYLFRARLVAVGEIAGEVSVRQGLWQTVQILSGIHPLEGFGWVGVWRSELAPFFAITTPNGRIPTSALNAFLDVWFQVGLVGLALFSVLLGLALVRAWFVASSRRSVIHVWPALVLVVLALLSVAESTVLIEYGWFLLVVCAVKAAQELSWRRGLR